MELCTNDAVIIPDPTALINAEDARLRDAIRHFDTAKSDYAANVTNNPLARGDHADEIRAELDARYRPALDEDRDAAYKAVESIRANARAIKRQTAHAEHVLTDAEMQSASVRRAFIRVDVETLSYPRLVDALRFAVTNGDRAAMYLLPGRFQGDSTGIARPRRGRTRPRQRSATGSGTC
jgi:hypothetical protein